MSLAGSTTAEKVWNYLKAKGLSDCGAAGLMGNLQAESGLNTNNLQNTSNSSLNMTDAEYTAAVDSGTYTNFVRDKAGYGLAQWTYWSRKQGLLDLAETYGKSIGDLELQLEYLFKELTGSFPSVLNALKAAESILDASNIVLIQFERPADTGPSTQEKRAGLGQSFYDTYATNGNNEPPASEQPTEAAYSAARLVAIAQSELGYIEKASNAQLDNPSANPGAANWTKYARDLAAAGYYNGGKNGFAWCDVFADWCFYILAGRNAKKAQEIECQTGPYGAGCIYSAQYYQQQGRYYTSGPQVGDQAFFISGGEICHTGIVETVNGNTITTIEGNSGDKVARRTYTLPNSYVHGFGRPKFDASSSDIAESPTIPGGPVAIDYITVKAPKLANGCEGVSVLVLQNVLLCRGCTLPKHGADSEFGKETEAAVKAFQATKGLEIDGVVGTQTWAALLA